MGPQEVTELLELPPQPRLLYIPEKMVLAWPHPSSFPTILHVELASITNPSKNKKTAPGFHHFPL